MKQEELGKVIAKAIAKELKARKTVSKSNKVATTDIKASKIAWYEKRFDIKAVKKNFKMELPTKNGTKSYDAVEFSNGRKAVFIKGGHVLKYAWNQ